MSALSKALTDAVIRRLAGAQSYQRGLDYFRQGHVASYEESGVSLRAVVRGAGNYVVTLTSDDGVLDYSCECSVGADGEFCKHCVAAGLAWLESKNEQKKKPEKPAKARKLTLADAGKVLREEDKDALVAQVLAWAKGNPKLREQIVLFAARRSGAEASIATVDHAFQKAVRVRGFLHYRQARSWARDVDRAIDSIDQLFQDGHAAAAIGLCESALSSLVGTAEQMDDSDGHFSDLRDRLQSIHFNACNEARPDPVELANRLFQWQMNGSFDVFYNAASDYAEILGSRGLAAYRELAEAEWEKVPARTTGDHYSGSSSHSSIRHIMESLAKSSGDLEQLISIKSRDLSSPYDYLRIAELYRDAGHYDQALSWIQRGIHASPKQPDNRLLEFAANEYHRRELHDDAMKLMWSTFTSQPTVDRYLTLELHAKKAGSWTEWRERALTEIRRRIGESKQRSQGRGAGSWIFELDHSQLVEIFLYEENSQQAWDEAKAGGCSDHLWLRLADARTEEHPKDAATVYLKYVENAVSTSRYEQAIELLLKASDAMNRTNEIPQFVSLLQVLCVKYKARRNFMALVNENRKSLHLT